MYMNVCLCGAMQDECSTRRFQIHDLAVPIGYSFILWTNLPLHAYIWLCLFMSVLVGTELL